MDMSAIAALLGLSGSGSVVRMAAELRRLCDINFDSSVLGIVSIPHGPLNYLLSLDPSVVRVSDAGFTFQVIFDRSEAVRMVMQLPWDAKFWMLEASNDALMLKVDKLKLIDLCGTSSSEFTTVMGLELPDVALEVAN
ncbi:hypothetical protein D1007_24074 [Hordeum vulgare]|nr:hypothetical protein D1007_24074 [Hordeum vulgare]